METARSSPYRDCYQFDRHQHDEARTEGDVLAQRQFEYHTHVRASEVTKRRISDKLLDEYQISLRCEEILADESTEYQHIQIVRTTFFGNALLLDGVIQLTELDNAGYHEMITHVPMLANDKPCNVLIVGGWGNPSAGAEISERRARHGMRA